MKVYFISGLAADKRVFKHIRLPEGFEAEFIDWITPDINESLETYALRLAEKINTKERFALVGLSFGGMIATEIAKKFSPSATILLSSVATSEQLPNYFKVAYKLKLHKLIPVPFLKSASIAKRFFTAETPGDKKIIRQVIQESDPRFIRWALGAILEWRNSIIPQSLWQIHGTNDEILPLKFTNPTHTIAKGSHMMVMVKATELNIMLHEALSSVNLNNH